MMLDQVEIVSKEVYCSESISFAVLLFTLRDSVIYHFCYLLQRSDCHGDNVVVYVRDPRSSDIAVAYAFVIEFQTKFQFKNAFHFTQCT